MSLLEVSGLRAGYGIVEVLFGIDLEVDVGELVVVLGANGSGKTTTLRAISGMLASRGDVVVDGRRMNGLRPDQLVAAGVAHVPQGRGTINDLTVEENLRIGAWTRTDSDVDADIAAGARISADWGNGETRRPGPCRAGSSRCWPSPGRS